MKKLLYLLLLITCYACEDVIDLDLNTEEPRVVIEATGIQNQDSDRGIVNARISKTVPYYSENIEYYSDAEINVRVNDSIYQLTFLENSSYFTDTLPMLYDADYELEIIFENETYTSTTQLFKSVPIDYVEQTNNAIDENFISINAYFTDPVEEENFYFFEFYSEEIGVITDSTDDELFNGNQISTFYADEFETGDQITITIQGVSEQFENFYSILSSQVGENGGNPFAANPASVRGNIINENNPENYAFGYFRMSQKYSLVYTVE
ncbi:DUF4249 family protein [Mesonia sp.]|uniref:DUF4249 family protein n=1 Tax=Mesonia sp. TaxID=1960830 RepID=UPI00176A6DAD|nr:DUF4249 family protein [Mesonia sp.]HIB36957.1 DUF4249 family protein [Mesonia sp.]HIO26125.1 DUF4249 family protein [Flavobacteriaceae bacterium]